MVKEKIKEYLAYLVENDISCDIILSSREKELEMVFGSSIETKVFSLNEVPKKAVCGTIVDLLKEINPYMHMEYFHQQGDMFASLKHTDLYAKVTNNITFFVDDYGILWQDYILSLETKDNTEIRQNNLDGIYNFLKNVLENTTEDLTISVNIGTLPGSLEVTISEIGTHVLDMSAFNDEDAIWAFDTLVFKEGKEYFQFKFQKNNENPYLVFELQDHMQKKKTLKETSEI